MSIAGSTIDYPVRPDIRGTLTTTKDRSVIIVQSIRSIIETRQGERVMIPDYGIPDFVFEVVDAGFTARLGFSVEEQIRRYEPLVDQVRVLAGVFDDDRFAPGFTEDEQRAAISVQYTERGSNTPRNLVFPTFRLRSGLEARQ